MILLTDRFIDGNAISTECSSWEEGEELQEAARDAPRIATSTLRDLTTSRYKMCAFNRPGITNFLRGQLHSVSSFQPHRFGAA